jgi:hypothetical protein
MSLDNHIQGFVRVPFSVPGPRRNQELRTCIAERGSKAMLACSTTISPTTICNTEPSDASLRTIHCTHVDPDNISQICVNCTVYLESPASKLVVAVDRPIIVRAWGYKTRCGACLGQGLAGDDERCWGSWASNSAATSSLRSRWPRERRSPCVYRRGASTLAVAP